MYVINKLDMEPSKDFFLGYVFTQKIISSLQLISLAIKEGRGNFFLTGPNGSGKTSMLVALRHMCWNQATTILEDVLISQEESLKMIVNDLSNYRIAVCTIKLNADKYSLENIITNEFSSMLSFPKTTISDFFDSSDEFHTNLNASGYDRILLLVDHLRMKLQGPNGALNLQFLQHFSKFAETQNIVTVFTLTDPLSNIIPSIKYSDQAKLESRFQVISLQNEDVTETPATIRRYRTLGLKAAFDSGDKEQTNRSPWDKLAKILRIYCGDQVLDYYLTSRHIDDGLIQSRLNLLGTIADPAELIHDLLSLAQLLELFPNSDSHPGVPLSIAQIREKVLLDLGFKIPKEPIGINKYQIELMKLSSDLKYAPNREDIIGIGIKGCGDIGEKVLVDLVHFYCSVLIGDKYEEILKHDKVLNKRFSKLTLGNKLIYIKKINDHLRENDDYREKMFLRFQRDWFMYNDEFTEESLKNIVDFRNSLGHPTEYDTNTLKQNTKKALTLLLDLFERLKNDMVYPEVVTVENVLHDKFNNTHITYRNDIGIRNRLNIKQDVNVGDVYFLYNQPNPTYFDAILVNRI